MLGNLGQYSIGVGRPIWLLLVPLLIPPLIWASYRSLAGLGRARRAVAILFRASVVTLIVLALAEAQMVRRVDTMTTLFLLDVSQSIPRDRLAPMLRYVNEAVRAHKRQGDLAGVIAFGKAPEGREPPPPFTPELTGIESTVDGEYTDLAAAIKLGLATYPEDTARRMVVVSDGNDNRGNALEQAAGGERPGRADRCLAGRVSLRPRGFGRADLDPAGREEGRDRQHQRGRPGERADPGHACRSARRPTITPRPRPATRSRCR